MVAPAARLVNEDTVALEFYATSADVLAAGEPNPGDDRQLPACPACCFATVRRHFPVTGGEGTVVSTTISEFEIAGATEEDDPVLHCFEERIRTMAGKLPAHVQRRRPPVREIEETCRLDEGE